MKKPLISIIIPCYNASKYIENTLQSVVSQTYLDWECIVINDGSKDNSLQLISNFINGNNKFKLINQTNKGLSVTRNLGIELAQGDYIYFLDADDKITSNCLHELTKHIDDETEIIVGKTATVKNNKYESVLAHPCEGHWQVLNNDLSGLVRTIEKYLTPVAQNRLYKKYFIEKHNLKFLSDIIHEDELWFFETNYFANKIVYINNTTYEYLTDNEESITNKIIDKNLLDVLIIIKTIYNKYYIKMSDDYKKNIIGFYILYLIKNTLDKVLTHDKKFSVDAKENMTKTFTHINIHINKVNFKYIDYLYYKMINQLKNDDLVTIKLKFFKNPVNSIRKKYKLIINSLIFKK
jgi:glycosyltransferase involved in cell wall biosynthesis